MDDDRCGGAGTHDAAAAAAATAADDAGRSGRCNATFDYNTQRRHALSRHDTRRFAAADVRPSRLCSCRVAHSRSGLPLPRIPARIDICNSMSLGEEVSDLGTVTDVESRRQ